MSDKFELSRRKMLAGLGTIGVAGAGAGMGTSALYTDVETSENNSITAGTLNMEVTAEVVAANPEYTDAVGAIDYLETADSDTAVAGYSFGDFKPGDWVIICWDIDIGENPGYVCIHGGNFSQGEGSPANTEPEPMTDNSDVPGEGDLGDKLLLTHWNGANSNTIDERSDLEELSQTTNKNSLTPQGGEWLKPDEDGRRNNNRHHTDVLEFLFGEDQDPANQNVPNASNGDLLGNGYGSTDGVVIRNTDTQNGGSEGGIGGPDTDVREVGSDDNTDNPDGVTFYQLIELPREVGNEVQGDTLSFDLAFKTVQTRNVGTDYGSLSGNIRDYPFQNQVDV